MIKSVANGALWPLTFGAFLIAVWYAVIAIFAIPEYQLPAVHRIAEAGVDQSDVLLTGATQTLIACLIGFFSSVIGGVLLSLEHRLRVVPAIIQPIPAKLLRRNSRRVGSIGERRVLLLICFL